MFEPPPAKGTATARVGGGGGAIAREAAAAAAGCSADGAAASATTPLPATAARALAKYGHPRRVRLSPDMVQLTEPVGAPAWRAKVEVSAAERARAAHRADPPTYRRRPDEPGMPAGNISTAWRDVGKPPGEISYAEVGHDNMQRS